MKGAPFAPLAPPVEGQGGQLPPCPPASFSSIMRAREAYPRLVKVKMTSVTPTDVIGISPSVDTKEPQFPVYF